MTYKVLQGMLAGNGCAAKFEIDGINHINKRKQLKVYVRLLPFITSGPRKAEREGGESEKSKKGLT